MCIIHFAQDQLASMSFVEVADIIGQYIGQKLETRASEFEGGVNMVPGYLLFGEFGAAKGAPTST